MRRLRTNVLPPLTLGVLLLAWEAAVRLFDLPQFVLPSPTRIAGRLVELGPTIVDHSTTTFTEAALGYAFGALVGLALAVAMTMVPILRAALYPIVLASQTTPKVALAPLFILWFGVDLLPKVVMVALLTFFPVLINTVAGLEGTDRARIDLMRSVNASTWQVYWHVRLPGAVPFIFAGLKLALTTSVIGAIIAEWVSSQRGLGFLLLAYNGQMRTADLFAVLVGLAVLTAASFLLLEAAERTLSWEARVGAGRATVVAQESTL